MIKYKAGAEIILIPCLYYNRVENLISEWVKRQPGKLFDGILICLNSFHQEIQGQHI